MYNEYLEFAKNIAYKTKEIMFKYFNVENSSSYKLDNTIVTIADKEINLKEEAYNDLKQLFTYPIKCLLRIYDSIDFWNKRYGNNGYYKMLEENVIPVYALGDYPYILEYEYIEDKNE